MPVTHFDPAKDGEIVWVDDDIIGFRCGCGYNKTLILSISKEDAIECDECGARLYYIQKIEVKCFLSEG